MVRFIQTRSGWQRCTPEQSQFHYGSIHTINQPIAKIWAGNGLNSTMVRFIRVDVHSMHVEKGFVSIPLWFDSYRFCLVMLLWRAERSQFHYGSIHTWAKTKVLLCSKWVSIPLWFDSYLSKNKSFCSAANESQFHYGSIHTQMHSSKGWMREVGLNSTMVRFILAKSFSLESFLVQRSQFHYGSIHTQNIFKSKYPMSEGLNSTMVRFIPSRFRMNRLRIGLSQFHYGSIHTNIRFSKWRA